MARTVVDGSGTLVSRLDYDAVDLFFHPLCINFQCVDTFKCFSLLVNAQIFCVQLTFSQWNHACALKPIGNLVNALGFQRASLNKVVGYISMIRDVYEILHKQKYVPNVRRACIILHRQQFCYSTCF